MLARILTSWMINMISFFIVSRLLHGFKFSNFWSLVAAGILLGIVNATFKPIFVIISLPIDILTLGLFLFIINGIVIEIVAMLDPGFMVSSFYDAIIGAVLLSIFSIIIDRLLLPHRRIA